MDYFRSAFESAKEQATKAAAEAKALAGQAQASAKLQAEEASRKLQVLQGDLKNLDLKKLDMSAVKSSMTTMTDSMNKAFATYTTGGGVSEQDRAEYGLTDDFIAHVKGFSYMLFMDFPVGHLEITRDLTPRSMPKTMKLAPWQEKHAMLLVQSIPEFNDLRYVLCPKKMAEERFWEIYFTLCKEKLPPQAQDFVMLAAQAVTVHTTTVTSTRTASTNIPSPPSYSHLISATATISPPSPPSRYSPIPPRKSCSHAFHALICPCRAGGRGGGLRGSRGVHSRSG
mmetsp:Transcript_23538/g.65258  ORF Transcript_23538/g.65258 Transcript_23538/m.65258 type:complete len:284 (-) Transcript_23538:433-1284(-)